MCELTSYLSGMCFDNIQIMNKLNENGDTSTETEVENKEPGLTAAAVLVGTEPSYQIVYDVTVAKQK